MLVRKITRTTQLRKQAATQPKPKNEKVQMEASALQFTTTRPVFFEYPRQNSYEKIAIPKEEVLLQKGNKEDKS